MCICKKKNQVLQDFYDKKGSSLHSTLYNFMAKSYVKCFPTFIVTILMCTRAFGILYQQLLLCV